MAKAFSRGVIIMRGLFLGADGGRGSFGWRRIAIRYVEIR
jgi:hypothetical protein